MTGLLRGLDHLVDDVLGRGAVGIAHAEVDDVFAAAARGDFQLPGDVEDVRREALNAAELFHDDSRIQGSGIRFQGSVAGASGRE